MKKNITFIFASIIAILFTACNESKQNTTELQTQKRVVIASKPMTEQFIIANMLKILIEQETDINVDYKEGIGGGTSSIHPAMLKAEIDIYPEYTGTAWMFVLKKELIKDPKELYDKVKKIYEDSFGIVWSQLYGFNDTFGLAIKKELADKLNIYSYSDLAAKSPQLRFGAEHDFFERDDGMIGIKKVYGFNFQKELGMDIGLKYPAIASDEVDAINIFSTDGRLKEHNMIVLEDDKNFFPSYFCATLIRKETLKKYPELKNVLDMMNGLLNNDEITELNYQVEIKKREAKEVAKEFLTKKGLVK